MKKRVKLLLALLVACVTGAFAQFDAGKTYVIANNNDANMFMQDNGTGGVALGAKNANSYWKFVATGNTDCYYIQNAKTGKYIQGYDAKEQEVATGDTGVEYYVKADADGSLSGKYRMSCTANSPHDFSNNTLGLNWKGGNNTVQSFTSVAGDNARSAWTVTEEAMPELSSPYTGSTPAEGDFFLYNVETGLWIQNNDKNTGDWNTRGATGDYGFAFGVSSVDNGWRLDPKFGHNHSMNSSNFYLDTSAELTIWSIVPVEVAGVSNAYAIKAGGQTLSLDNNKNLAWNTGKCDVWQLVTREERLAYLKANATSENPIDATFLIMDPRFANENERASAWTWNQNGGNRDDVRWYRNRRSYAIWNSNSFSISQTINDIPNGYYKLNVKGYYRDGNKDQCAERRTNKTEQHIGKYFLNNDKADLMSILDGASSTWVDGLFFYPAANADAPYGHYPDNADGFNRIFQDYPNNYMNAGLVSTVTTKSAKIGLEKLQQNNADWIAWDEFYLTYLGPIDVTEYVEALNTAITAAENTDVSNTTNALKTELANSLALAKATLSSDDTDKLSEVTAALNAAIDKVKAVNITFLRQTIALAKADGIDTSAAEDFVENGTSASEMGNLLSALRIARRVANAEKDNNTYAGNVPAAGDFYLLNVGQKRFLCGGDDWGAHAALGFPGIVITLEADGENFHINTHLPNGGTNEYLTYNGYCDTGKGDTWKLIAQGDGKYVIARSNNAAALLGYSNNTYNRLDTDKNGADNPDNQWILVTKAQRDALYEAAAQVTDQPAKAVDVSYLIKSPNFSQREDVSAWALNNTSIWGRGDNHPDFAIEAFNQTSASVEQTVTGLKPGTYRLKVQAFYRDGNFDKQAEILKGGGEARQLATLYAGTKSALIQNVSGGADKAPGMGRSSSVGYMPDGIDDACLFFQSGLYWAQLDNIVVTSTNPSITFGARKTEQINGGDWFVLDNFRLEYLGAYVDLSEVKGALSAKITEAKSTMTIPVTFLSNAITNAETAMGELQDADVIVNANIALTNALNKYITAKNDLIILQQTVEKANAEELDENAALATAKSVADADQLVSVIEQQLYNVRADRKINALRTADVYTGAAPAEGKVYLYNIGTGMFLGMGSDWNTHAAVDQVGIEITLEADGDNFKLITAYGSFNDGEYGPYVDTGTKTPYTFVAVEGKANVYNIKQGDLLMGWNPNAATGGRKYWNSISNVAGASATDANYQWKLITADEREALEAAASDVNAVDVSYKISNPSLVRKPEYDMWQKTAGARVSTTNDNDGNRAADYGFEFFDTNNFSFTQTVTGLKPGNYRVSVQGFYRDGDGGYQAGVVNNGGDLLQKAYLVGGDAQAFLPNIASKMDVVPGLTDIQATDKGAFPNWPNSAIEYFQHGAYWTTVNAKVGANGELTIGVKKDEKANGGDWVVLDNFRLAYLGAPYGINTMSIMGDFTGGWDFADNQHMTQDANDPYIWTLTVDNFKPTETKSYIYKATANERWDVYEYPQGEGKNQDWYFGSNEYPINHYYTLVFTMNTATHTLTLNVTMKTNVVTINEDETFVPEDNAGATIVLNRTFNTNAEAWNTFVVPFNISNSELKRAFGEKVAVAEYSENSDDPENVTVHFDTMDEPAVTANVPVLLKTNTTAKEFVFEADVVAGDSVKAGKNFDLVGSYAGSLTIAEGDYFLNDHTLYKSAGATKLKGTRAYLKAKTAQAARIANIVFDEEEGVVTGITEIATEKASERIYNLSGQKVNAMQRKGIYIKDGKKVMK
ncbi:hypothetical protein L6475_01425 [Prevotella sp. E9-3]|uniref:hypothetical protein n=1 Tax=Prevotella sp. E9-3 TaxID=2913621 RepID=UPI001EDA37CD|nr:hypothetical protein [Prevotella sp. E9-3]UKK48654.1 hypothetical protein L6475_01425 [Prevotella sp. E9-3]